MIKRTKKVEEETKSIGNYFLSPKSIDFVSSGCSLLDCVLGGGYPIGRIVNIVGDRSSGKCVKNAYVLSPTLGLVRLDDLARDFSYGATEWTHMLGKSKGNQAAVSHFYKEKVFKTFKITSKHGHSVEGTPDHKVEVWTQKCAWEMKRLEEIQKDDYLCITTGLNIFPKELVCIEKEIKEALTKETPWSIVPVLPNQIIPDMAKLMGYIVADGNLLQNCVFLANGKKWFRKEVDRIIEKWGLSFTKQGISNKIFYHLMVDLLWTDKKNNYTAHFKRVPDCILASPKEVQISFLQGLIDCDGYYDKNSDLEYSTSSEVLATQVKMMLLNLGIFCSHFRKDGAKVGEKYYDHVYHSIFIDGPYLIKYAKIVGSLKYDFSGSLKKKYIAKSKKYSIPFLYKRFLEDRNKARSFVGWAKNGRMKIGGFFPSVGGICESQFINISYSKLNEIVGEFSRIAEYFDLSLYRDILEKDYVYDPISSIEVIEKETEVYDVHIPGDHLFWCNGMINHNTLLAIEAVVNFLLQYPDGKVFYHEVEAAFDREYARNLGMPVDKVEFVEDTYTVEALFDKLQSVVKEEENVKKLYILDSLDALSDEAERGRDIDEGSFGAQKAKKMSELFRRITSDMSKANVLLIVISQVRDKIGVMFGPRHSRSGGRALDFYASQVIWLVETKKIKKTVQGIERPIAIEVLAQCKKNKVGLPYRECSFPIVFGYGVDEINASLAWLKSVKELEKLNLGLKENAQLKTYFNRISGSEENKKLLTKVVLEVWNSIESEFLPTSKKYS